MRLWLAPAWALRIPPSDLNMAGENGPSALMMAARQGFTSGVTLLLADERVGFNVASEGSDTALMIAADEGRAPVVTLLLVRSQHHSLAQKHVEKRPESTRNRPSYHPLRAGAGVGFVVANRRRSWPLCALGFFLPITTTIYIKKSNLLTSPVFQKPKPP